MPAEGSRPCGTGPTPDGTGGIGGTDGFVAWGGAFENTPETIFGTD
jgi:hypothetical protein